MKMQLTEFLNKCQELSDIVGNNKILAKKSKKNIKKKTKLFKNMKLVLINN